MPLLIVSGKECRAHFNCFKEYQAALAANESKEGVLAYRCNKTALIFQQHTDTIQGHLITNRTLTIQEG